MDIQTLSNILDVSSGTLTVGSTTLTGLDLAKLLVVNAGRAIAIKNAVKKAAADGITITGSSDFMDLVNADAKAVFKLDAANNPEMTLRLLCTGAGGAPGVSLVKVLDAFGQSTAALPAGFDIVMSEASLVLEAGSAGYSFNLAAKTSAGLTMFTVQSTPQPGFTAGMQLGSEQLSSLAGLQPIAAIENFVGLSGVTLIVSSMSAPSVPFPDTSMFDAPSIDGKIQLPPQASGLAAGMNAYAQLTAGNNQAFNALAKWLKVRLDGSVGITLTITAPSPATGSKLFLSYNGSVQSGVSLNGTFGVLLQTTGPAAFVVGTAKTSIQGQAAQFDVASIVGTTGILVSGTFQGTVSFHTVKLSNLALVIGIDYAGIPSLGVAATINTASFGGSAAVFFDSTNPGASMVAGATDDVKLADIATALAGQASLPPAVSEAFGQIGIGGLKSFSSSIASALDARDLGAIRAAFQGAGITLSSADSSLLLVANQLGSMWHLTDLAQPPAHYRLSAQGGSVQVALQAQLYIAPQQTTIGTLSFPAGFRVTGMLQFFFLNVRVDVIVVENQGVSADVDLDPIVVGPQGFFAITGAGGSGKARLSLASYAKQSDTPALAQPHALISGSVVILGATFASVFLNFAGNGIVIALRQSIGPVSFDLNGTLSSLTNFRLGGTANIGYANRQVNLGALGTVNVNTTVSGALALSFDGTNAAATFQGSFSFQNLANAAIPPINLNVSTPALANLADTVWQEVVQVISKAVTSATLWLSWVSGGVISGIDTSPQSVGRILGSTFNLGASAIAGDVKAIGYNTAQIAQALSGAGVPVNDAINVLHSLGASAADISAAISGAFRSVHGDVGFGHVDTPVVHVDRGSGFLHVDTNTPHVDTGTHIDTNRR